jgi:hypothetical protein
MERKFVKRKELFRKYYTFVYNEREREREQEPCQLWQFLEIFLKYFAPGSWWLL